MDYEDGICQNSNNVTNQRANANICMSTMHAHIRDPSKMGITSSLSVIDLVSADIIGGGMSLSPCAGQHALPGSPCGWHLQHSRCWRPAVDLEGGIPQLKLAWSTAGPGAVDLG